VAAASCSFQWRRRGDGFKLFSSAVTALAAWRRCLGYWQHGDGFVGRRILGGTTVMLHSSNLVNALEGGCGGYCCGIDCFSRLFS
jgi:hypothetical protein